MQSITDIDQGTPKSTSDKTVTIEIDGVPVTVPAGSPPEASHRGSGHLRLVDTCHPDTAQLHRADEPVQLPM